MSPATAALPRGRTSSRTPLAPAPRRRAAPPVRAAPTAPRTRPRPATRPVAPNPARSRVVTTTPARVAVRRGHRVRSVLLTLLAATIVITIAGFHAVLAQNQMRLEEVRARTAAAEARYDAARLENGRLAAPESVMRRAAEMGLEVPAEAPVAIPLTGTVPRRGSGSATIQGWSEVKRYLDASP